ncbi:CHAP domain-containing protein [Aggregicoccus sp. 17bor-14]|uniref:CHAP domain-containing protein n=1 Tax=Myxococcaceae TaxID=31 RepID=UPI00129C2235|nr:MULTISPECIES: CHAP domain-containing protein [Myxococcaceae]MBF5043997.1 CHAP domain-containing protein [Simulacricoccus sp. 17bor-14]MRI89748.1 CHAP domain-containing protein [Aggregicoccus sp. 17bor-14]
MNRIPALLATLALTGCATGAPTGGRSAQAALRYRPLTPAAAPRAVPSRSAPVLARVETPRETPAPRAPAPSSAAPVAARPTSPARSAPAAPAEARERVVAAARSALGQTRVVLAGRQWPSDCTGLVQGAFAQGGHPLRGAAQAGDNGVTALYRYAQVHGRIFTGGRPLPGDLVFFRDTYDQNRDGRRNDGLTHVGLVEDVSAAGTVTVIHRVSSGVVRYRMNLARPQLRKDPRTGEVLNDLLRSPGRGRPQALTGQLFAAYATVLPVASVAQR